MAAKGNDEQAESRAAFPSTVWSLIRAAQRASADHHGDALGNLLSRYWKPIYAYYRSRGKTREQAADLVQGFFYSFVKTEKILKVQRLEKRFRDWLLVCARHYMLDQFRREKAVKRRPTEGLVSFEALREQDGEAFEPAANEDPRRAFDEAWRRDLLDRAFRAVADECDAKDRSGDYRIFVDYYCNSQPVQPTWQEIAARYAIANWKEATRKADWVKSRLSQAIRNEVAHYVDREEDIDEEIRALFR
jgi:RNA polymerase sigma-70 factor (ECF subfamily)